MKISVLLLLASLALTGLGGIMDMTNTSIWGLSRQHMWNDGMYLAVLAIAVHLILRL
jgi:hypothetical protein